MQKNWWDLWEILTQRSYNSYDFKGSKGGDFIAD